jgi:AmmeMemoRadiSam system protein A
LELTAAFGEGDFLKLLSFSPDFAEAAAECGLRSFQMMAGALDKKAVTHELLSYEGPFGVGYGVAYFEVTGEDASRNFGERFEEGERSRISEIRKGEDEYVRLARLSLETYVRTGKRAKLPSGLPEDMTGRRAGTFVSLKKRGQLRGCIGTISATAASVAEEIMQNAVSSAVNDPRFDPVTEDELNDLEISVDVLGEAEEIDSPDKLDVKRYGVIVQNGGRRGLLLPNLEGVNTVEEQISISKQKAGIRPSEQVKLSRFEVVRHK